MTPTIKNLEFLFTWRPYQAKVLANFSKHIDDNHFHVVAPPGSGKTILGIEILKRIRKKTLVLTPTLTIRNQWEDRLQNFFTKDCDFKNFSFDIKQPADITFSTYQALHSLYKTFDTDAQYFQFFTDNGIEVLLLDEAHHLKNAWWKCLYQLKEQHLQTIVALTATPPYDSEGSEIHKYFSLCGEIDDEINVPELVKEKNLCPHQDLIFLSKPQEHEINFIADFRLKIASFVSQTLKDLVFINFLKQHRFYKNTENYLEEIYKFSEFFSAILIFLNEANHTVPLEKLEILGFEKNEVIEFPKITNQWIQILFQHILVTDRENLIEKENYINTLEKQLRKLSVFSKNKVNLIGNELLYKSLSNSPSKLKSIAAIVQQEKENLQSDLRCVILSDYIRKEYLDNNSIETKDFQKIGVVPIFLYLNSSLKNKEYIAVLTGSLVIIHSTLLAKLELITSINDYSYTPLKSNSEFIILSSKTSSKKTIVETITQLFELGHIKILIGTKSLLGEGWDAPCINSLILASVVGSFVSSNQMRGRAIRIDTKVPNKAALIWHLACVDTSDEYGGRDFEILSRRFNAFLGISNHKTTTISNGIERLNIPKKITLEDIDAINQNTLTFSKGRQDINNDWKFAVFKGSQVSKEIKRFHQEDQQFRKQKKLYYQDIIKYTTGEILIGLSFFLPQFLLKNINVLLHKGVLYFVYSLLTGLGLTFGYKIYQTIRMYLHYGLINKKIHKIGYAILATLNELTYLSTPKNTISINTELLAQGNVICTIEGANRYESNLFITALNYILKPIDNPKYLLIKTNWLQRRLKLQNFFSVPEIFGVRKNDALIFQKNWKKHLGNSKLIYTRNKKGRKLLLKARLYHVHNLHKETTRKSLIWK